MRGKHPTKLLIVIALTLVSFVVVGQFFGVFGSSATESPKAKERDSPLLEIAKYRQWTLVNPTPVLMDPASARACAIDQGSAYNPHERKYVSVYVNPVGASAMMTQIHPRFPEGSIIVKEKLNGKLSQTPELLTVMIKRKKGYNPKSRDWQYLVLDGQASRILERGKPSSCNGCHAAYVHTDFVTRHYLPGIVRRRLR